MSAAPVLTMLAALQQADAMPPVQAQGVYTTPNYNLTFQGPAGTTYCPLPSGWVGSDHGTTIFLTPPAACGGVGYPSSSRDFSPADTPRIDVYYGYAPDDDDVPQPASCDAVGRSRLLGQHRTLCRNRQNGLISISIQSTYSADAPAELVIRLTTTANRIKQDMETLVAFAASVRTCTTHWKRPNGRIETAGKGAPCPEGGWF